MSRLRLLPFTLFLITAVLFVACKPSSSTALAPSSTLQPTPTITPTATPSHLAAWADEAYPLSQFPVNGMLIIHFSQPMLVVGQAPPSFIIPEVEGTFAWSEDRMTLTFTPASGEFPTGKSYVVTLNRNLKSASGDTFATTQRWTLNVGAVTAALVPTFTPGPTRTPAPVPPRLISRLPAGKLITDRSLEVKIAFNKTMDQDSVAAALTLSPEVPYTLSWDHHTLNIHLTERLAVGTTYAFTLAETAHDLSGIALPQASTWTYFTPDTLARASYPSDSGRDTPIAFYFNYPIAPDSLAGALQIEPAVIGEFTWNETGTVATFAPGENLPANTPLTFTFTRALVTPDGETLPPPTPVSFTTPPPIIYNFPTGHRANPASRIQIVFDRLMDETITNAAFHITPETPGQITWEETTLIFTPERAAFLENTEYTVTLNPTALDADGELVIGEPYTWTFTTQQFEAVAKFAEYGPNAQVLDADGRRAVQFALYPGGNSTLQFELYRMTVSQFVSRYSSGFRGVVGWETPPVIPTEGLELQTAWDEAFSGGELEAVKEVFIPADVPPGLFIFNMKTGDLLNAQLILVVSCHTLAVKQAEGELTAWLTDINADGATSSIAGADIFLYTRDGALLRQGTTDENGLYRTAVTQDPAPLIVVAHVEDDITATGLSPEWTSSGGYWWGWWQPTPQTRTFSAHILTDRPIYKPGQTVYFKAIIRRDQDALLSLPAEETPITVRIRDARNNVVTTMELLTTEFGTVNGEFALAEGAMLGDYAVELDWNDDSLQQIFKVQDYRKPDLQVTVTTEAPSYVEGDNIIVHVDTRYFFGEPVPNAQLTILKFARSQGYYDWWQDEYIEGEDWIKPWDSQPISGQTDENGQYTFTLPATIFWSQDDYYSDWRSSQERASWGIEVTADDGSHQTVSGFATVSVYSNVEEITVDTSGYLKTPGEGFPLKAAVHDIFGNPVEGRTLTIELRRWSASSYNYETVVQSDQMTTGPDGVASLDFVAEEPGYYQLRASSTDARGNLIEYRTGLYIFSEASLWMREETNDLQITAEQNTYISGDTARLLIESSFSGPALLTFERGTVREELPVQLTAPLTVLEVPIRADYAPNIFIVVNAYRPIDTTLEDQEYYFESIPDSELLTASTEVQVPVTDKTLIVTITPDKETYTPREEATFTIQVTNQNGVPVSAELSLALVDEAIFSLSDELSGPILASFYDPRAHIVRTYNSMALRRILSYGGMGGGGGDDFLPGGPRSDFPDTAAWFPVLQTDDNGEVIVTLTLPDSLTTWRLTAKATTGETHKFGEATANFLTQHPIIVRPILPRTLTAGDQVMLSAMVHNYSGEPLQLRITINEENALLQLPEFPTQTITLASGEHQMVGWMATALASGEAKITVTAMTPPGGAADAVQITLPIRPLAIPDVTTLVGDFTSPLDTELIWPGDALGISTIKIELSRSVAGTLLTGLDYLTGFPYGCVEQTMSKALPNAVVGRAFNQLGISDPTIQADLPAQINAGLQRLYGFQHNDGGWGWWYDDATHDYQTAWVVFGLSVTAQAGYEVDPGVIERGAAWLNEHLAAMDVRTQAFALYAVAISGHGNLEAAHSLYAASFDQLDSFSRASLALAFHELGAADAARAIVDTLAETATQQDGEVFWAGEDHDGYYEQKTMSSATRSTALALSAFVQIRPQHPLEPGLVRWLMGQRTHQGWGTTNETSFAIIALTDHLLAAEFATANTTYEIELNGAVIASGQLGPGEPAVSLEIPADQLRAGTNDLTLRQTGNLPLYYVVNSRVYLPQSEIAAAGVVDVTRQYLDPATNQPLDTVLPGELVKVVLTVDLPDTTSYMLVEDQLPGGLEALNENLNTTSHIADAVNEYGEFTEFFYWQELGYNYKEIRAGRVTFFITEMTPGTHTFTYLARAIYGGAFVAMPAEAYAMYDLDTWGRSSTAVIVVGK